MKKYESIIILKPDISEDEKKKIIKNCKKFMKKVSVEEWGIRKLAYPVKKQERGYYILFTFEHDGPNCDDLNKMYKQNEETIIKSLIILKDNECIDE